MNEGITRDYGVGDGYGLNDVVDGRIVGGFEELIKDLLKEL